jgi:diketogulonate reductase-like aldo/keto reductase
VLAKSVTPSRIKANHQLVKLDEEDQAAIAAYAEDSTAKNGVTRFVYPPFGVSFGFPDKP